MRWGGGGIEIDTASVRGNVEIYTGLVAPGDRMGLKGGVGGGVQIDTASVRGNVEIHKELALPGGTVGFEGGEVGYRNRYGISEREC